MSVKLEVIWYLIGFLFVWMFFIKIHVYKVHKDWLLMENFKISTTSTDDISLKMINDLFVLGKGRLTSLFLVRVD